jgi:predicted transcriptional regulator
MNEHIGFVLGNRQRERIIQVLGSKGNMSAEKIAKVERITPPGIKRVLSELEAKGLVAAKDGAYGLTKLGEEVEKELKRRT